MEKYQQCVCPKCGTNFVCYVLEDGTIIQTHIIIN